MKDTRPKIEVCLSPRLIDLFKPEGKVVIIIDILRATSTICTIINNGGLSVIPVESLEDCFKFSGRQDHLLAAERQGKKPSGFPLGNSPFDYPSEVVKDKTIVLTTTNGTRAIKSSEGSKETIIGSFLNIDALCEWTKKEGRDTILFCAGWKDHLNFEDSLFAGAVLEKLKNEFQSTLDSTLAVRYLYKNLDGKISSVIKHSSHFKRLSKLGLHEDIDYCLQFNTMNVLPILNGDRIVSFDKKIPQETTGSSF